HLNEFITEANRAMDNITEKYEDEVLGRTIHNVTVIHGGNQVNSIPETASLQANIRSIPSYSNDDIIHTLQAIVDKLNEKTDYHLELKVDYNKQSVKSPKDSALIQSILNVSDKDLPLTGLSATTDAAEFTKSAQPFDLVVYGPGEPTLPHQVDEYVQIDNYLDMIEQYQNIAKEYLK
ncbi:M20/M25/M40 family metallo-hydrolase, partial [Carnobacterium sp.]|uniref:M20/M25/M40 family metallo-hydrolase n=1 Tax=Carnobacterium sp. TaxID=48221 RepID=UPI0028AAD223